MGLAVDVIRKERPLRKARLIVSIPLVAGVVGLAAPAASAAPGTDFTYGACVSSGIFDPSLGVFGPGGINPNTPTGRTGTDNARVQSDGHSRFVTGVVCPKS